MSKQEKPPKPLPWPVEVGFRIFMGLGGLTLIVVAAVGEMTAHEHSVITYIGHAIFIGFGILLVLVAFRGLTRTVTFAKGIAQAWKAKG